MEAILGTKYLERFGGSGKARDIGITQFQVMDKGQYWRCREMVGAWALGFFCGRRFVRIFNAFKS